MTMETKINRKPAYRLFHVVGDGEAANWTPIGAAWSHRDHLGFGISLDLFPLIGRIVMRAVSETSEGNGGQQ